MKMIYLILSIGILSGCQFQYVEHNDEDSSCEQILVGGIGDCGESDCWCPKGCTGYNDTDCFWAGQWE